MLDREALQDSVVFYSSRIGLRNSYYFRCEIPVLVLLREVMTGQRPAIYGQPCSQAT